MKKITLVAAVLVIAGCKTKSELVAPTYSHQSFPIVGSTATVGIGEQMLTQGDATTVEALVLAEGVTFGDVMVRAGSYPFTRKNDEYQEFQNVNYVKGNRPRGNGKLYLFAKDAGTPTLCLNRKNCTTAQFSMGKVTTYSRSSSQQTLIYSGKIGNKVTLGYREFINDVARPAFSNDVAYDLSESTTLGYKGARIEVVSATNTEITYKVISGFK